MHDQNNINIIPKGDTFQYNYSIYLLKNQELYALVVPETFVGEHGQKLIAITEGQVATCPYKYDVYKG
jgi:hypothetical protein